MDKAFEVDSMIVSRMPEGFWEADINLCFCSVSKPQTLIRVGTDFFETAISDGLDCLNQALW